MNHSTPGLLVYHQLPESTQTHVHWVGDASQPSYSLSSLSPALNLSQHQGLFKWVSSLYQVAKYWSFSFNISPSNEHPGLISFRMDWLDHQIGWHEISSSLPLSRVSKGERSWLWLAAVPLPPTAWHPHPFPRHLARECQGSPPL